MRDVPISQVTAGTREAMMAEANVGTYIDVGVTVFDCAGRVSESGVLEPNGYIVVDSYYVDLILYMLPGGEVVRLVD